MEASFYSRVRLLPEFNGEANKRFKDAKVLVIGAGGLGCPVLLGLNSVGFGAIGIMDGDKVDMTNLSRQILFSMEDVGRPKAQVAVEKLAKSGSDTTFVPISEYASAGNITSFIRQYDVIIDCTDNFQTRYLINDACFIENKVLVFGAVHQYEGSVSVFHYKEGPTLRCLYPSQPQDNVIGGCNENGILPTVTTLIGATMANEAIKIVGGFGRVLSGKLLTINLSTLQFDTISFKKSDTTNYPRQILESNYAIDPCGTEEANSISVEELNQWRIEKRSFQLVDVRTSKEFAFCNLGGINIPLEHLEANMHRISKDLPVIVLCHHGSRSSTAISMLHTQGMKGKMYHVDGGIHAWAVRIDPKMPVY